MQFRAAIVALSAVFQIPLMAAEWNQFRGPNGSGVAARAKLPVKIDPAKPTWKVPVPVGHSSPVLWGGKLFLTGLVDGRLATLAFDAVTGKQLWLRQTPEVPLERVHQASSLRLDGLFCYPGHISGTVAEQTPKLRQLSEFLKEAMDQWKQHGLPCETVSSGTSPTAFQSHLVPELTEIRPGTNVFKDLNLTYGGYCQIEDCAARIITTVVSNAVPDQIVLDAGSKTLSSDLCGPAPHSGHGYIVEYPEAKIKRLTEEHAQVDVSACDHRPVIGERVSVIPNHICVCVNLQDRIWWQESGSAPEIQAWNVDARGKLS